MSHRLSATLELKDKFSATVNTSVSAFEKLRKKLKETSSSYKAFDNAISKTYSNLKRKSTEHASTINKLKGIQSSLYKVGIRSVVGLATGTSAVGAFLHKSYMTYVDLNEQLERNAGLTGANAKEQEAMANQVRYLGRTMKFTAKEVAEAHMYQAMAGYNTNQILEATPTLLRLSIASGEDLARTSDMITDNLSALGMTVKDLPMYADLLASMAMRTNTNVSMLSDVFAKTGAVMRQVGKEDVREMATAFGLLADAGIKGAEAGTAVKSIYGRLAKAKDDKKMMALFGKYKITLYKKGKNGKDEWKGLLQIIEEMKPKFEQMSAAEQNYFLTTVAGLHHMDAFGVLLKANKDALDRAKGAAYNATGALEKFENKLKGTDRYKVDELKSAWEGFMEKLGAGLSPIFLEGMEKLTKYLNELTDSKKLSTENITKFFNKITGLAKTAGLAFLAAHVAFLAWRASMGDVTAIAQLGAVAAAGIGVAGYLGWDYLKTRKDSTEVDAEKQQEIEKTKAKMNAKYNPAKVTSLQNLNGESSGLKDKAKIQQFLSSQAVNNNRSRNTQDMNVNVDLSGIVVKESVDVDNLAAKVAKQLEFQLANQLRTQLGLQS